MKILLTLSCILAASFAASIENNHEDTSQLNLQADLMANRVKRAYIPMIIPGTTSIRIAQVINGGSAASRVSSGSRAAAGAAAGAAGTIVSNSGGGFGAPSGYYSRADNHHSASRRVLNDVQQQGSVYCGPAIAEAILTYMGMPWDRVQKTFDFQRIQEPHRPVSYQNYLATHFMKTHLVKYQNERLTGTSVVNFKDAVNSFISKYNLNQQRLYQVREIGPWMDRSELLNLFYHTVKDALQNGKPVPFAYAGDENHFILIKSVSGSPQSATYTAMDPAIGSKLYLNTDDVIGRIQRTSYLLF